jgi:uncharacterized delta-60 repeat protein
MSIRSRLRPASVSACARRHPQGKAARGQGAGGRFVEPFEVLETRRLLAATYLMSGLTEINEGNYQLTLSVQGAAATTISKWNVDWGDDSSQDVFPAGSASVSVTHNFDGDALPRITARAFLTNNTVAIAESANLSGNLDVTFGSGGTFVDGPVGTPKSVVLDSNGGSIVAYQDSAAGVVRLRRYTAAGEAGLGWGNDALTHTTVVPFNNNSSGDEVSLLIHGGALYVGGKSDNGQGNSDFAIARFGLTNGTPDLAWGPSGLRLYDINSAGGNDSVNVLASQGSNIIAAGQTTSNAGAPFAMLRLTTTGALATPFGTNGVVTSTVSGWTPADVSVLADGSIVAAGTTGSGGNLVVQRFNNSSGASVWSSTVSASTFGVGSNFGTLSGMGVAVQPDGKIVVASSAKVANDFEVVLVRLTPNGALDPTFVDGNISHNYGSGIFSLDRPGFDTIYDLLLRPDGTLLTLGGSEVNGKQFTVSAFREFHGSVGPNTNFGTDFGATFTAVGPASEIRAAAVTPGGSIVAVGFSDNAPDNHIALARYGRDLGVSVINVGPAIVVEDNVFVRPNQPVALDVFEPSSDDRNAGYWGFADFDLDDNQDPFLYGMDESGFFGDTVPLPVYASEGTYRVSISVNDKDGGGNSRDFYVHVGSTNFQQVVPDPAHPGQYMLLVGADDGPTWAGVANNIQVTSVTGGISVKIDGVTTVHTDPVSRVVLYGNGGDDTLQVKGSLAVPIEMYGGAGADKLKGDVFADILVGGAGDDLVVGDVGRDFLIGGEGADKLVGDADDDILIGGTYAQAGRRPATSAILAEWTSGRTYQQRVDNLRDGSGTATRFNQLRDQDNNLLEDFFLSNDRLFKTVYDDFAPDRLTGNAGEDWFFANVDGPVVDKITDLLSSEFSDADRNFVNEL